MLFPESQACLQEKYNLLLFSRIAEKPFQLYYIRKTNKKDQTIDVGWAKALACSQSSRLYLAVGDSKAKIILT